MRLQRTSDISRPQMDDLYRALKPYVKVEIDQDFVGYKSTDAPSWIRLIGDFSWWQQALSAYAALYVAEIVKEAAKESWRCRSKIVSTISTSTNSIRAIARAIKASADTYKTRNKIILFIPEPNSHFGTGLRLFTDSEEELEAQLALFAHHLPGIREILERNSALNPDPATGYFLQITNDGDMCVEWFHPTTLEKLSATLPLRDNI